MTDELLENPIPSTVEIGPHSYEIVAVDDPHAPLSKFTATHSLGSCDYDRSTIYLRTAKSGMCSETQEIDTVLHEIIHAILIHLGFDERLKAVEEDDANAEWFVAPFTTILLDVIRRNPLVMGYLEGMNG